MRTNFISYRGESYEHKCSWTATPCCRTMIKTAIICALFKSSVMRDQNANKTIRELPTSTIPTQKRTLAPFSLLVKRLTICVANFGAMTSLFWQDPWNPIKNLYCNTGKFFNSLVSDLCKTHIIRASGHNRLQNSHHIPFRDQFQGRRFVWKLF